MLILSVLLITPLIVAQSKAQQQTSPQSVNAAPHSPELLELLPWDKLLAFLGCVTIIQTLVNRLIIKPIVHAESELQLSKVRAEFAIMKTEFANKLAFELHEKLDKDFQERIEKYIDRASRDDD